MRGRKLTGSSSGSHRHHREPGDVEHGRLEARLDGEQHAGHASAPARAGEGEARRVDVGPRRRVVDRAAHLARPAEHLVAMRDRAVGSSSSMRRSAAVACARRSDRPRRDRCARCSRRTPSTSVRVIAQELRIGRRPEHDRLERRPRVLRQEHAPPACARLSPGTSNSTSSRTQSAALESRATTFAFSGV